MPKLRMSATNLCSACVFTLLCLIKRRGRQEDVNVPMCKQTLLAKSKKSFYENDAILADTRNCNMPLH
jgi:hypothetical protein